MSLPRLGERFEILGFFYSDRSEAMDLVASFYLSVSLVLGGIVCYQLFS